MMQIIKCIIVRRRLFDGFIGNRQNVGVCHLFSSAGKSNENEEPVLITTFGTGPNPTATNSDAWRIPAEQYVSKWRTIFYPTQACGSRAYALIGPLADMEQALIDHAFDVVSAEFASSERLQFLEVSDVIPRQTTIDCGLIQQPGSHPIQYLVPGATESDYVRALSEASTSDGSSSSNGTEVGGLCLSGTAEMGIADQLKGRTFNEAELPVYFCAESRCFRPEISKSASEGGLYRVHEFNKLEMFAVCTESQSDDVLERIVRVQRAILEPLGLHCRLLDMPCAELGPAASRKFDIEAWMPGRRIWGELTSASNCKDYQSRRLDICYINSREQQQRQQQATNVDAEQQQLDRTQKHFAHTCNGTALATSRAIIALIEANQRKKGRMALPPSIKSRMPDTSAPPIRMQRAPPFKYNFEDAS